MNLFIISLLGTIFLIPNDSQAQPPYFYILDVRNYTWVTQFEPEQQLNITTTADNGKKIGIILGTVGLSIVIGTIAGILGYKFYKKQRIYKPKRAKHCMSYN